MFTKKKNTKITIKIIMLNVFIENKIKCVDMVTKKF